MNAKQIKFYETVHGFFSSDMGAKSIDKYFGAMLKLDYTSAEDLWEYMLTCREKELSDGAFTKLYVDKVFSLFFASSASRTLKTIVDRPVISNAVFRYSPSVTDGELFALPINLLVSNKADIVDGLLKLVAKNEAMGVSFGEYMIKFLDRFFIEVMKKNAQRKVELNRKQSTLLLSTVQKVKGDERAMLVQRVKEVQ